MADEPGGHRIENLAQAEAGCRGDAYDDLLEIVDLLLRQGRQASPLDVDALGDAGVAPADDLIDEPAIVGERVELRQASQQKRVGERLLEMAVGAFDSAVLMGEPAVVAAGDHAVMGAK